MFNNQFFQLNRIQHQIPWKGEKMKDKLSRLFACLIAVFMVIAMVGMSSTAKAEDGAETPIATATPTAETTDDSVAEVPEVDATEVDSAAKGEKPETKTTKTPKPTATATVEPTKEPTQAPKPTKAPKPTATATVEPTEEPTEEPTQTPTSTATATVEPTDDPTEDPTDPPIVLPDTPVSECTNGVWTITITYPADAYGDANGAILWYDGQLQEESGNLDPGESYTFEIRAGLNSLELHWYGWASQYPDVWWEFQRPSDCGSPSDPKPSPTPTKPTAKPTPSAPAEPTVKPTAKPTVKPTAKPTAKSSDDKKSDDRKGSPSTGVVDDDGGVQGVALATILVMSAVAGTAAIKRRKN